MTDIVSSSRPILRMGQRCHRPPPGGRHSHPGDLQRPHHRDRDRELSPGSHPGQAVEGEVGDVGQRIFWRAALAAPRSNSVASKEPPTHSR
jgi:hypothetical protein